MRREGRGMALLLVLAFASMGTVMSLALLSVSSLQVETLRNARRAARAEYLAESGVSVGMYYLLHPEQSPAALVASPFRDTVYYPGQLGLPVGDEGDAVDVRVEATGADTYRVAAVGRPAGEGASADFARRKSCVVRVRSAFAFRHAGLFPGAYQINGQWTVANAAGATVASGDGGLRGDGAVSGSSATVAGPVYAAGTPAPPAVARPPFPRDASVRLDRSKFAADFATTAVAAPQYTWTDGKRYSAQKLTAGAGQAVAVPSGWRAGPTGLNPGNVWYADDEVLLTGPATLNGTLILRGYKSLVLGANLEVNPQPGMPALIVGDHLLFDGPSRRLTARGLVYVGDDVRGDDFWKGYDCLIDVRGALMTSTGPTADVRQAKRPVDPALFSGQVRLTYDPAALRIPDYAARDPAPKSLDIIDWDSQ